MTRLASVPEACEEAGEESVSAVISERSSRPGPKLTWFDISEDDDDDFFAPKQPPAYSIAPIKTTTAAWRSILVYAWVHVFLFNEIAVVGRISAACSFFRRNVWDDNQFWSSFGGFSFASLIVPTSPALTRSAFQRWLHDLQGAWGARLSARAPSRHVADVFSDATFMLQGLRCAIQSNVVEVQAFVTCLTTILESFDSACPQSLHRARQFVACALQSAAVLPVGAPVLMKELLEASIQRDVALCVIMPC